MNALITALTGVAGCAVVLLLLLSQVHAAEEGICRTDSECVAQCVSEGYSQQECEAW